MDNKHSTKQYRKAISNPSLKQKIANLDLLCLDYKHSNYGLSKIMKNPPKCSKSLPTEIMYGLKNPERSLSFLTTNMNSFIQKPNKKPKCNKPDDIDNKLVKQRTKVKKKKSDKFQKPESSKSKHRKKASILSMETPSLINTDSFKTARVPVKPIMKTNESRIFTILGKVISDISEILSHHVLRKDCNQIYRRSSASSSDITNDDLDIHVTDGTIKSDDHVIGAIVDLEDTDNEIETKHDKSRIEERRFIPKKIPNCHQDKNYSLPDASVVVNPSSIVSSDSRLNQLSPQQVQEYSKQEKKYHTNLEIIERLSKECQADKTFKRLMKKWAIKYRIDHKDYHAKRADSIKIHQHNIMKLTGSQTLMINKRSTMITLHRLNSYNYNKKINSKKNQLYFDEEKRLRKLKNLGLITKNFDELETEIHNFQSYEKPHIAYNSSRPIFNENPNAHMYKLLLKDGHQEIVLQEKKEEDIHSVGDVSFLSDSSIKYTYPSPVKQANDEIDANEKKHNVKNGVKHDLFPISRVKENVRYYMETNKQKISSIYEQQTLDKMYKVASTIIQGNHEATNKTHSPIRGQHSMDTLKLISLVTESEMINR